MTLQEYLIDYAKDGTQAAGEELIKSEIGNIPNEKMRSIVIEHLEEIKQGGRDFRV
jgi:2-iminoacetate synthase